MNCLFDKCVPNMQVWVSAGQSNACAER